MLEVDILLEVVDNKGTRSEDVYNNRLELETLIQTHGLLMYR